jgi:hypothetical protein
MRPVGDELLRVKCNGEIALAVIGTFAAHVVPDMLKGFLGSGTESSLTNILFVELDKITRDSVIQEIPEVFRGRLVIPNMRCPAGWFSATIQRMLTFREYWWVDLKAGVHEWLTKLLHAGEPAMLVVLVSPGAHAVFGRPAIEAFRERFPHAKVYVVVVIDGKDVLRKRFPEVRKYYADVCHGMIVVDNRRGYARNDTGIALLFSAFVAGKWLTSQGLGLNAPALVFPEDVPPPRLATIRVQAVPIPVYRLAKDGPLPEVYWTRQDAVEQALIDLIKSVVSGEHLKAIALPTAQGGRVRPLFLIAPIHPESYIHNINRVEESMESLMSEDPNLSLNWVSLGAYLEPDTTETVIVAVLFEALDATEEDVDGIALDTLPVDPKFLGNGNGAKPPTKRLTAQKRKEKSDAK